LTCRSTRPGADVRAVDRDGRTPRARIDGHDRRDRPVLDDHRVLDQDRVPGAHDGVDERDGAHASAYPRWRRSPRPPSAAVRALVQLDEAVEGAAHGRAGPRRGRARPRDPRAARARGRRRAPPRERSAPRRSSTSAGTGCGSGPNPLGDELVVALGQPPIARIGADDEQQAGRPRVDRQADEVGTLALQHGPDLVDVAGPRPRRAFAGGHLHAARAARRRRRPHSTIPNGARR
jgi:hypothetical protein